METQPIRVLLVDDDQGDFEMIRVMLAQAQHQKFELQWVSSYEEALDALEPPGFDVYFLDYFLEDRTGLDVLREAKDRGVTAPIIMLTGRGSRAVDMEAMELGASDYLVKSLIDPDVLERAIRHALERARAAGKGSSPSGAGFSMPAEAEAGSEPAEEAGSFRDRARFRALFATTRSGVAFVGLDGGIMAVNPAFAGMFSAQGRWAEGMPYQNLLDESDREAAVKELQVLSTGDSARFEAARRYVTADGSVFWTHSTTTLIRKPDGEPDHLMVILEPAEGR